MKPKHVLPVPFSLSPYGYTAGTAYEHILKIAGASEKAGAYSPSNLIERQCSIHAPVEFTSFENDQPQSGHYLRTLQSLQHNLADRVCSIMNDAETLAIIGGDHSISVGTGLGLSRCFDLSQIGLIWIDAHADSNTPETSLSKSLTGCPVAINAGLGPKQLTQPFCGNFIRHVAQIGLRDIDEMEMGNVHQMKSTIFSILDVVELGMKTVIDRALRSLSHCKYIWLSIDIDSLDSVYFQPGETDVPCPGGLSPRELLYLVNSVRRSGKLKIFELTQVNDLGKQTPVMVLSSRILEMALGLGQFRYGGAASGSEAIASQSFSIPAVGAQSPQFSHSPIRAFT